MATKTYIISTNKGAKKVEATSEQIAIGKLAADDGFKSIYEMNRGQLFHCGEIFSMIFNFCPMCGDDLTEIKNALTAKYEAEDKAKNA